MIRFTTAAYGVSLLVSILTYLFRGETPWGQTFLFSSHLAGCLIALFTGLLLETLFDLPETLGYYFGMACGIVVIGVILKLIEAGTGIVLTVAICNACFGILFCFRHRLRPRKSGSSPPKKTTTHWE